MREFPSLPRESSSGYLCALIRGSICRQRRCYGKRDADAPLSLFRGLESDWNVRTSSQPALSSFVVGKFRSFHDQAVAEETSGSGWGRRRRRRRNNLLPRIHTHQLEAPSRSRCRRCLRILAIFRPAAPDENSSPLLFFFFPHVACCHLTCSAERRRVATVGSTVIVENKFVFGWK